MPVYKYFGNPARYHGKPLMHLLCNLKETGRGRIVSRVSHEVDQASGPSFYRVLWAQPLMDKETKEGRVVAEKVRKGVRYLEPVDLASIAPIPDFRLVSRDEEAEFCKWDKLRDYSPKVDCVTEPKYFSMPPLLGLLMDRNMKERGEVAGAESHLLPHYKTYVPKDQEADLLPGEKKERVVRHQETITMCEGEANYQYGDKVEAVYHPAPGVLDLLPEEPPFPQPLVGMRLYKVPISDKFNKHKEEVRTEEHNTYLP